MSQRHFDPASEQSAFQVQPTIRYRRWSYHTTLRLSSGKGPVLRPPGTLRTASPDELIDWLHAKRPALLLLSCHPSSTANSFSSTLAKNRLSVQL